MAKRFICALLALFQTFSVAFAEERQSAMDSVGAWFDQAVKDTGTWASHAWKDTSEWAGQAWQDTSKWATNAWGDVSAWAGQAWADISAWTIQAWNDSSKWVARAWSDSSSWVETNWDHFIVWANMIAVGNPYSWISDAVLENGILAYDEYVEMLTFLDGNPSPDELHQRYDGALTELSMLNEDKTVLWQMLQEWSEKKGLSTEQTSKLALPFLARLLIEGETVIGEDAPLSGPVVGQYLLTILEAMNLDSAGKADMQLKILHTALEGLTRPTIIGDTEQNILVTDYVELPSEEKYSEYMTEVLDTIYKDVSGELATE